MEQKFEIIRLNGDVIVTSCQSAIAWSRVSDGPNGYVRNGYTREEIENIMMNRYGTDLGDAYNKMGLTHGSAYHVLSDGTIEPCENEAFHSGDGWILIMDE